MASLSDGGVWLWPDEDDDEDVEDEEDELDSPAENEC